MVHVSKLPWLVDLNPPCLYVDALSSSTRSAMAEAGITSVILITHVTY